MRGVDAGIDHGHDLAGAAADRPRRRSPDPQEPPLQRVVRIIVSGGGNGGDQKAKENHPNGRPSHHAYCNERGSRRFVSVRVS